MTNYEVTNIREDSEARAAYIELNNINRPGCVAHTREVSPDLIYVDTDTRNMPVGVEILENLHDLYITDLRPLWEQWPSIAPQVTEAIIRHARG